MGKVKKLLFSKDFSPPSEILSLPLAELKEKYLLLIEANNYSDEYRREINNNWRRLETAMNESGIENYSSSVGEAYLSARKQVVKQPKSDSRFIYVLNCIVMEADIQRRSVSSSAVGIPDVFLPIYEEYIDFCIQQGNKAQTIASKKRYTRYFFSNLYDCGCSTLDDLTPDLVLQASKEKVDDRCWSHYRLILSFLVDMKKISYDYSSLIPKAHPGIRLPDVYTKDEILKLEASVDRSKPEGKRDYAVIIVASRLNLRNSDIAGLLFDAVDFVNNSISICQKKTNGKLQLPLLPEVKAALNDYINNARPQSNEPFIFLRTKAPYTRLQDATIYAIVRKALNASGIKNKGRRQGAQALRASGATNKVNSDVPYSLVRKSLGHQSENAIQHYASLDVEHLRKCALEPPPITKGSSFEIFLKGDTITCK